MKKEIAYLKGKLHTHLLASGEKISFAESCTGGMLQKEMTDLSGSSAYFDGGLVVYSNRLKHELLHVSEEILLNYGAVSSECAEAMVEGLHNLVDVDLCISVTGIAGPGGGSELKPVGTVWFGFYYKGRVKSVVKLFSGDRDSVREQSVCFALAEICRILEI